MSLILCEGSWQLSILFDLYPQGLSPMFSVWFSSLGSWFSWQIFHYGWLIMSWSQLIMVTKYFLNFILCKYFLIISETLICTFDIDNYDFGGFHIGFFITSFALPILAIIIMYLILLVSLWKTVSTRISK